jgi:hypothetical protein
LKRDIVIALVAIILVFAITFGVSAMRVPVPMRPTQPFSLEGGEAPIPSTAAPEAPVGKVIIRVNGEPVTEQEFAAAFATLPQEVQQQYNSEQGKQAFAEQLVRMKLLEQEAHKRGLDRDPAVAGQLAAQRMNIMAGAAAEKLVPNASPQAVQKFYAENAQRLQTMDLYHIVVAYKGGAIPPRKGPPLDEQAATNKALQIYQKLKEGMPFEQAAKELSDDQQSAARGGFLGAAARHTVPLEQVRERISQRVQQQETVEKVEGLRKTAQIYFDPKFFPDAKNWSSAR